MDASEGPAASLHADALARALPGLIGIPYRPGGEDFDGADCYGLVRLAYRVVLGAMLPPAPTGPEGAAGQPWEPCPPERPMAVLLFVAPFGGWHVALSTGRGTMLHVLEGGVSHVAPLTGLWRRLLQGAWLWRGS